MKPSASRRQHSRSGRGPPQEAEPRPELLPIPSAVFRQLEYLHVSQETPACFSEEESESEGREEEVSVSESPDLLRAGLASMQRPTKEPQFSKSDLRRVFKWADSMDSSGLGAEAHDQELALLSALFADAVADQAAIDTQSLTRHPLLPPHRLACGLSADLYRRTTVRTRRYVQVLQPLLSELSRCLYREARAEAVADRVAQRLTPQLRCSAYFEEAQGLRKELDRRLEEKRVQDIIREKMLEMSNKRQAFLGRKEQSWRFSIMRQCFNSWRSTMRENRRKVAMARRYFSRLYGLQKDTVFRSWRDLSQRNKLQRLANNSSEVSRRVEKLEYELAEAEENEREVELELARNQSETTELKTAIHNAKKELREQRERELALTLTAMAKAVRRVAPVAIAAIKGSLRQLLEMPNALVLIPEVLPEREHAHLGRLGLRRDAERGTHLSARQGRTRRQERRELRRAVVGATQPRDELGFAEEGGEGEGAGAGDHGGECSGWGTESGEGGDRSSQRRGPTRHKEEGHTMALDSSDDEGPLARHTARSSASAVHRYLAEAAPHVASAFPTFSQQPQQGEEGLEVLADWFWGREAYAEALPFQRLLGLTTDRILVAWINWHVSRAMPFGEKAGLFARRARNLGSDLDDGEILAVLVEQLHPGVAHGLGARARAMIDPEARIELIMKTLRLFSPSAADVVSTNLVLNKDSTLISALLARLFCTHPGLRFSPHAARAQSTVNACIRRWGGCRAAIDAVLEEGAIESTPVQRMQMLASEIQEFCRAMASARVVLGEGLRCARSGTILYRHLFPRMVDLQWYVFCAKMLKQVPPFTDERHAEELRHFAEVSPEDVVTLLVSETERVGGSLAGSGSSKDAASGATGLSDERERRVAREAGAAGKEKGLSPELARAETVQAMRVLARHAEPLLRVFGHYSAGGPEGGEVITAAEFRYFVRDAKLRDATVTAPVVERVFASSAVEVGGSSAGGEGKGEGDGEVEVSGLRPRQFLSALLRLAMLRYERPPDAGAREPTLAPRLALLLRQYVIPNALKSDVDQFRKMLNRQEVRDVLRVHREPLQRVFRFYADGTVGAPAEEPGAPATPKKKEGKKKGKQGRRSVVAEQPKRPPAAPPMAFNPLGIPASSRIAPEAGFVSEGGPPASAMRLPAMSVAAFIRLLSDARVLDYGLDDATARKLFANVQKEEDAADAGAHGGKSRLVYPEFQEALAAISFFKVPNPYIPLHARVDTMITSQILPHAKQSRR